MTNTEIKAAFFVVVFVVVFDFFVVLFIVFYCNLL